MTFSGRECCTNGHYCITCRLSCCALIRVVLRLDRSIVLTHYAAFGRIIIRYTFVTTVYLSNLGWYVPRISLHNTRVFLKIRVYIYLAQIIGPDLGLGATASVRLRQFHITFSNPWVDIYATIFDKVPNSGGVSHFTQRTHTVS